MSIKVASWNVEKRLTRVTNKERGTPEHILSGIKKLDADVLVLPEAYQVQPEFGVDEQLEEWGYTWLDAHYDDTERTSPDETRPHMRMLSRLAIRESEIMRFGGLRNTVTIGIDDPDTRRRVRITGVHLRDESEELRLRQVGDLTAHISDSNELPVLAAGDWNAMHGGDMRAHMLGSTALRFAARHVPHAATRYVAMRLTDMATGAVLREFENRTGMRDLDPGHRPTTTPKMRGREVLPSVRFAQIDHMYANDFIDADVPAIGKDGGSDHRSLRTIVRVIEK